MKTVALGGQGLEVSQLGYGCMGLTTAYGKKLPDDEIIKMLETTYESGITLWDTAFLYSYLDLWRLLQLRAPVVCQEEIIGKALKKVKRENIVLATKTGIELKVFPTFNFSSCGRRDFIRKQCEESLKRLQTDYIDIYYLHRIDQTIPIEISMLEMKKLHHEKKIKYVGLSECSPKTIRRAHKIHPLSVVELEYSLWSRGIEGEIIDTCNELNIGIVAYSPLGRGFLTSTVTENVTKDENDKVQIGKFGNDDFRKTEGRFNENNLKLIQNVEAIAEAKGVTLAQLALAWVLHQGHRMNDDNGIVPIPGTTKLKNLKSNVEAVDIELTPEDLEALQEAVPADRVEGDRYSDTFSRNSTWEADNNIELTEEEGRQVELELQSYED